MIREIDQFYYQQEEPNRSCLLALRSLILEKDPDVSETRKWGMPCFSYKKKMFCFLWTDKLSNDPYILFVEGKHLDHPLLEKGSRSRMKILRIKAHEDIPIRTIKPLLDKALNLYRNGVIKTSR